MGDDAKAYPFDCGSQYGDWTSRNCDRCAKGVVQENADTPPSCDIYEVIFMAYLSDGSVPRSIAERMGYFDNSPPRQQGFSYSWPCKEFLARIEAGRPGAQ